MSCVGCKYYDDSVDCCNADERCYMDGYYEGIDKARDELPTSLYVDGFNDGYEKGKADAIDEFARAYEHAELIGCENCKHLDDDIHCWRCVAEQLKEQSK